MQLFAGAETMRRFSSILNDTWPKDMPPAEISSIAIRGRLFAEQAERAST